MKQNIIRSEQSSIVKTNKIGYVTVTNINNVERDIKNVYKKNNIMKNGYSFLLRIKNEQDTIEKCILDIVDLADEIIVVDNNSTDNTLKIILDLEKKYNNIFVYEYKIKIPNVGKEHINNLNKNNTLANYYNWTASKATYNKKIKWDGDFYAIRENLIEMLDKYRDVDDLMAVWFSGLTLFIHENDFYYKNYSYYNEYRMFYNNTNKIWSDNIVNNKNYCETSINFVNMIKNKYKYVKPIYIEIKNTNKDEFSSRSSLLQDSQDNVDFNILYGLSNNMIHISLIKTSNIIEDCKLFELNDELKYVYKNNQLKYITEDDKLVESNNQLKYITEDDKLVESNNQLKYITEDDKLVESTYLNTQNIKILLIIDSYGWAFDNISKNIKKYVNKYNFDIITYNELSKKIKNNSQISNPDHIIFFAYWNSNKIILDYFYTKNIKSINLCIYDYSLWCNNDNKQNQLILYNNLLYFFKKINYCLYASPYILNIIQEKKLFNHNNMYKCYDGVDTDLFTYCEYNNDIYTKEKLNIGWIGNSNPNTHGINKGFSMIKKTVEKMNNKFNFIPQDKYTGKYLPHNEIPNYIKNIDIIICFSLAEGTPNQILEASACGRCWISTKVGICEELYNTIPNNPTGIFVDRNTEKLIYALNYLYYNRNLIVQYGKNGRDAIIKNWTWKQKANEFFNFIQHVE